MDFVLCPDPSCTSVTWTRTLPYTLRTFEVTSPPLNFVAAQGAATSPLEIAITPPDDGQRLQLLVEHDGGAAPWIVGARSSDSAFAVSASALSLSPGSYTGRACVIVAGWTKDTGLCSEATFSVTSGP